MVTLGSRESRDTVKAVLCGSSLFGTICGSENLSTRVGERGATIRPLGKFLDGWKSHKLGRTGCGGVPSPADHKGHLFNSDIFGGDDEVAFVLTIGRVEDYDKFSLSCYPQVVC